MGLSDVVSTSPAMKDVDGSEMLGAGGMMLPPYSVRPSPQFSRPGPEMTSILPGRRAAWLWQGYHGARVEKIPLGLVGDRVPRIFFLFENDLNTCVLWYLFLFSSLFYLLPLQLCKDLHNSEEGFIPKYKLNEDDSEVLIWPLLAKNLFYSYILLHEAASEESGEWLTLSESSSCEN